MYVYIYKLLLYTEDVLNICCLFVVCLGGSGQEGFDALRGDGRKPRQVHEEWAGREHVGALLQRQGMQILRRTLLSQ